MRLLPHPRYFMNAPNSEDRVSYVYKVTHYDIHNTIAQGFSCRRGFMPVSFLRSELLYNRLTGLETIALEEITEEEYEECMSNLPQGLRIDLGVDS